jgi:adenosylmethionine-8-amino-7-oxononanoate aminotransferase
MSVCDPDGGMHALWAGVLPEQLFVPAPPLGFAVPPDPAYLATVAQAVESQANELAAVIVEPVVQGAGGMRFHHPGYLTALRELCDTHRVLLIFDEIATGFGRTGKLFAADQAGLRPDVMCVGKALTGGYVSQAAALCTAEVAAGIRGGPHPVLAHGPTFMGNPLASAVANASLGLLAGGGWRADVARIQQDLGDHLAHLRHRAGVTDVRVLGAIGVVELDRAVDLPAATAAAVAAGVWLRPFRNLVYTMPPYPTSTADVALICQGIDAAVAAVLDQPKET